VARHENSLANGVFLKAKCLKRDAKWGGAQKIRSFCKKALAGPRTDP
jgi:hypothetical protein